jgi:ribokinase
VGSRVVVVGSLNVDLVVGMERLPQPGETVLAHSFDRHAGGKGLNQAVACARLGGNVTMLGAVGDDASGTWLRSILQEDGIDGSNVRTLPGPSGTALIEVENGGENRIVVVPGANAQISAHDITAGIRDLADVGIVLVQAEMPLPLVEAALRAAHERGAITIFNPSPVTDFSRDLLKLVSVIVPNEHEAAILTGMDTTSSVDATEAALRFNEIGIGTAIITRGGKGCVWASGANTGSVPTFKVQPVDTVGAGDAFCGGLAAALSFGLPMSEALRWASATGALATTKAGAVSSLPYRESVEELLELNG